MTIITSVQKLEATDAAQAEKYPKKYVELKYAKIETTTKGPSKRIARKGRPTKQRAPCTQQLASSSERAYQAESHSRGILTAMATATPETKGDKKKKKKTITSNTSSTSNTLNTSNTVETFDGGF